MSNVQFISGGLANKVKEWQKISEDPWILSTVSGYKIEFDETPFQYKIPLPIKFNQKQTEIIDQEVLELLNKRAISKSKFETNQFISNIFIVEKKNGKFRPVINLTKLNEFISYHHLKMETLDVVLSSIKRYSYFVSTDLKDAYLSVPIDMRDRKYLKFLWKGVLYQCNALIFGLASAPGVFTKLMKPIFAFIRQQGISSFYYIDDSLIEADNFAQCEQHANFLVDLLEKLGFFVNREKSVLVPSTTIHCLGHILDSVKFKVFLRDEKIDKIITYSDTLLNKKVLTIREVARLIGLFTSSLHAINLGALFF